MIRSSRVTKENNLASLICTHSPYLNIELLPLGWTLDFSERVENDLAVRGFVYCIPPQFFLWFILIKVNHFWIRHGTEVAAEEVNTIEPEFLKVTNRRAWSSTQAFLRYQLPFRVIQPLGPMLPKIRQRFNFHFDVLCLCMMLYFVLRFGFGLFLVDGYMRHVLHVVFVVVNALVVQKVVSSFLLVICRAATASTWWHAFQSASWVAMLCERGMHGNLVMLLTTTFTAGRDAAHKAQRVAVLLEEFLWKNKLITYTEESRLSVVSLCKYRDEGF